MKYIVILVALLLLSQVVLSQTAQDDLVQDFPGFGNYNYDIYSGMLNVTRDGSRQIHYVLVESQNDPMNDPIVVWLNGGPGCSSLLGLVQENGPFMFTGNNPFFTPNPEFSWNRKYNVLYLEGPPGVGFSINNDKDYKYTEDNTGEDFLQAYVKFRERFQNTLNVNNDLWITGESYAGMYIPFFSKHILQYNKQNPNNAIPLKGMLIGNGVTIVDYPLKYQYKQQTYVENHFFNRDLTDGFNHCKKYGRLSAKCNKFSNVYGNIVNNTDNYQIYNYTYSYQETGSSSMARWIKEVLNEQKANNLEDSPFIEAVKQLKNSRKIVDQQGGDDVVLSPDDIINGYFNLQNVRKALHVEKSPAWEECSNYVGQYYIRGKDSNHLFPSFFDAGLRVLIYSGNTDAQVPHSYTTYQIQEMVKNPEYNVTLSPEGKWRQWYPEGSQQVGGMIQYYKTNTGSEFVYTMVRAAGHEVPEYQPRASWYMLNQFIQNKPL